jgi:SAM-dependent methyltransferase
VAEKQGLTHMNYQAVEEVIKTDYREVTPRYRRDDDIEVTTENHRRIGARLKEICILFDRPIRVLDAGCGTGRYFHCLTNVRELTGIDITEEMLRAAEDPVLKEEISVPEIRLVQANILSIRFPPASFDFIYSLGMFGNGCPVTADLCNKFHDWLAPRGILFFDTVDFAGLPLGYRIRKRARREVYPLLPRRWQNALDEREAQHPFFGLTKEGLKEIMDRSRFDTFEIESHVCESPLWNGRHLECIAAKAG